jgi:hypothetical protein
LIDCLLACLLACLLVVVVVVVVRVVVDDRGIHHLLLLTKLAHLELGGTSVTDDGVVLVINGLRQLETLSICNLSELTERGICKLCAISPR